MTIALGILASDGIVLAADTEMTWGDYIKTEGAKISVFRDSGLAIAGAGDGDYLEAVAYDLERAYRSLNSNDFARIERTLQATLATFHRQHVTPLKDPNLDVWLLIGLQRREKRVLWTTRKSTMRPCVYSAIGIGAADAHSLFTQFFEGERYPDVTVKMAQIIAVYLVYMVKERVRGCGKNTDMVLIHDGTTEQLSRSDVRGLEYHVNRLLDLQAHVAQFALGYILTNDEKQVAETLTRVLVNARREYDDMAFMRGQSFSGTIGTTPDPMPSAPFPAEESATKPVPRRSTRGRTRRPPSRA